MEFTENESLDPSTWLGRIRRLAQSSQGPEADAPARLIRLASYLARLAPEPIRELMPQTWDEARVEAFLDCGAYDSAVMALLGPRSFFTAERRLDHDEVDVTVTLDPASMPGIASHKICAMAMLSAWAQCLANLADGGGASRRGRRKSRSGPPPSSTAH